MLFTFVTLYNPAPQTSHLQNKQQTIQYTHETMQNDYGRTQKMVTQLTQFIASDYAPKH